MYIVLTGSIVISHVAYMLYYVNLQLIGSLLPWTPQVDNPSLHLINPISAGTEVDLFSGVHCIMIKNYDWKHWILNFFRSPAYDILQ